MPTRPNSERQRGYAIEAGRRSVYTPQMIINGTTNIVGARPMELSRVISEHAARTPVVALDVARAGDVVSISATTTHHNTSLLVHMVRYQPARTARITRGENAGHTLTYANVTEDWKILQEWHEVSALTLEARVAGAHPLVVMIQEGRTGPILAAARIR